MQTYDSDSGLAKFNFARLRSERVLFVLLSNEAHSQSLLEVNRLYIKNYLFFLCQSNLKKILNWGDLLACSAQLSAQADFVVLVNPQFLLKTEELVDAALISSIKLNGERTSIVDLDTKEVILTVIGRVQLLKYLSRGQTMGSFLSIENSANNIDAFAEEGDKFIFVSLTSERLAAQTLSLARKSILNHLECSFPSPFLFNTELYDDIARLPADENIGFVAGVASGFKLHYLIANRSPHIHAALYFDSNAQSLMLKKKMYEEWNGENFVDWIQKNQIIQKFKTAEKSIEEVDLLWARELNSWGGCESFRNHWCDQKNIKFDFLHKDILDLPEVLREFSHGGKTVLWVSNVWNNEHTFHRFGAEKVKSIYSEWIKSLATNNHDIYLLQSKIFLGDKTFYCSGSTATDISRQLI